MSKKWSGADMRCKVCNKYLPDRCACNGPSIEERQAAQAAPGDRFLAWWTAIETDTRKSLLVGAHRDPERLHALLRLAYEADRVLPAQPAPASTGREPLDVEFKRLADTILQATTNGARLEALRSMAALFDSLATPAAARELDVEAELLAAADAVVARWDSPKWKDEAPTADYIARLRRAIAAARSAAQSTAPVSTKQAGDAWISVEDLLPEAGKWVIVSHRTEYVNAPPQQSVSTALFDGAYWWNHGHHIYTPTHWQSMPAAPSPNNSPVGAKERDND